MLLTERGDQVAAVHTALDAAETGAGSMLLVQGQAGLGKTALLDVAGQLARDRQFRVLWGSGGLLEREASYAVVREMFTPVLELGPSAGVIHTVLGVDGVAAIGPSPTERVAAAQSLTSLVRQLSAEQPLMLVVDDAHAVDPDSAYWLRYLLRQLAVLRIVCVLGARPGSEQLAALPASELVRPLDLHPLTTDGVASVLAARLPHWPDSVGNAVHEATGGNPLLVAKSVAALSRLRDPVHLDAGAVREAVVTDVSAVVLHQLTEGSPHARTVAEAVAVLGRDADAHLVSGLADVPLDDAVRESHRLVTEGILAPGWPARFAHPLLEEAVLEAAAAADRSTLHARAAGLLAADGARDERAAAHLLRTDPVGDEDRVRLLRRVAARDLDRGAAVTAVRYLQRALAEPPRGAVMAEVLLDLARAAARADMAESVEWFAQAAEATADPGVRSSAYRERGWALLASGAAEPALDAYESALSEMAPDDTGRLELLAEMLAIAQMEVLTPFEVNRLRERLPAVDSGDRSVDGRRALAALAFSAFTRGDEPTRANSLAIAAIGDGRVPARVFLESPAFLHARDVLALSDDPATTLRLSRAAEDWALETGSPTLLVGARWAVATAAFYQGDLFTADDVTDAVFQSASDGLVSPLQAFLVLPLRLRALIARGHDEAADALVQSTALTDLPREMLPFSLALFARADFWLARGEHERALDEARFVGDRLSQFGILNPAIFPWRSVAVTALARLGRHAEALELAAEDIDAARACGIPRVIGASLLARARVQGDHVEADLAEAVDVLAQSADRLTRARALVACGAWHRRAGHRRVAGDFLVDGRRLALDCGAAPLAGEAADELAAVGVRKVDRPVRGVDALTPSERRVAELAAAGAANAEIADRLFVSVKTVEAHLGAAYRKLGITSRRQLRDADL